MEEKIEELTMLLLYLTAWDEDGFMYDENIIYLIQSLKIVGKVIRLTP